MFYLSRETDLRTHLGREHGVSLSSSAPDMDPYLAHVAAHLRDLALADGQQIVSGHAHAEDPAWPDRSEPTELRLLLELAWSAEYVLAEARALRGRRDVTGSAIHNCHAALFETWGLPELARIYERFFAAISPLRAGAGPDR